MSNVISSARFLSKMTDAERDAAGVSDEQVYDSFGLSPVTGTEQVVGTLSGDQLAMACLYLQVLAEVDELECLGSAEVMRQMADKLEMSKSIQKVDLRDMHSSEAVKAMHSRYARIQRKLGAVKGVLFYELSELYEIHGRKIGLRANRKVVVYGSFDG